MNIPDRIYAQYRTKPNAVAWYKIIPDIAEEFVPGLEQVRNLYDIDGNVGAQLDIIGRVIVQDRAFTGQISLDPALFDLTDGGEFGDTEAIFANPTVDQDSQMSDELYRIAIRAKIIKNNSDATIDSILDGMNFLLPNAEMLRVTDGEDMSFSIEFYGQITNLQRWALLNGSFVPRPQGVNFNGFLEGYQLPEFGDTDLEFGDTDAEFVGFIGV